MSNAATSSEQASSTKMIRLLNYIEEMGMNPSIVLEQANLTTTVEEYRAADFIPKEDIGKAFIAIKDLVAHSNQSIVWASGISRNSFKLLCRCMESSSNLWEALERAEEFTELQTEDKYTISFSVNSEHAVIEYNLETQFPEDKEPPAPIDVLNKDRVNAFTACSGMHVWHKLCCWLVGEHIEVSRADFNFAFIDDDYHESLLARFSYIPLTYDCDSNKLYIPKKYLDYKLVNSKDSMDSFLENMLLELLAFPDNSQSVKNKIKTMLGSNFANGTPSFEEIADTINTSPSGLRRKLIKENTSYQKIKDECRRDIAIDLLRRGQLSISEISKKLGYIETGSFSRSFKQWTGESPHNYKKSCSSS